MRKIEAIYPRVPSPRKQMELLELPIENLVDVRRALQSLDDIKDNFSKFDLKLAPIEDAYKVTAARGGFVNVLLLFWSLLFLWL